MGGSHSHGHEDPLLVRPVSDRMPNPRESAGGDPMGAGLFTHHLPPGVADLLPAPDHDPESRRQYPENAHLDTVQPVASNYHAGIASDFSQTSVTSCNPGPLQKAKKPYSLTPQLTLPLFQEQ